MIFSAGMLALAYYGRERWDTIAANRS